MDDIDIVGDSNPTPALHVRVRPYTLTRTNALYIGL